MNRAFLMGCVAAFGVAAFGAAAGWAFGHWLGWWGLLISVPLGLMVGNAVGRGWVMTAVVEVDDRPPSPSPPPGAGLAGAASPMAAPPQPPTAARRTT